MKPPRVIEIPKHIQGSLRILYERAQWSDDRIAQYTADVLIEIQRRITAIEQNMQKLIAGNIPEDVKSFTLDTVAMVIIETLPDEQEGRKFPLPESVHQSLFYLTSEADVCREAAKLSGLPAVAIAERTQAVAGEMKALIQQNIPQCANGDWSIDVRNMMVTEIIQETTKSS